MASDHSHEPHDASQHTAPLKRSEIKPRRGLLFDVIERSFGAQYSLLLGVLAFLLALVGLMLKSNEVEDGDLLGWLFNAPRMTAIGVLFLVSGVGRIVFRYRRVVADIRDEIEELTQLIAAEPGNAEHYADRATTYAMYTQHTDLALDDYTRAIELAPDDWGVLACRAETNFDAGRFEEAADDLTRAMVLILESGEHDPDSWALYYLRAECRIELGDRGRAIEDLTEVIRIESIAVKEEAQRNPPPTGMTALWEKARRWILDFSGTESQKSLAITYYDRASQHLQVGDSVAAKEDFRAARKIDRMGTYDPRVGTRIWRLAVASAVMVASLSALYGLYVWLLP